MSRFQAVIFDLDGVITDTARYHYLAWKRLADAEGMPFDEALNERLKGVDRLGSLELILGAAAARYPASKKLALAESKNRHYLELIAEMSAADLLPGALQVLSSLRMRGLGIGLASASRNALTVLGRLGLCDAFDYVADAALVERGKPDPEIFLTAARGLGVAPAACLGVEDAAAGIAAIRSAGMYALGVGSRDMLEGADAVIPNLLDFRLDDYQD